MATSRSGFALVAVLWVLIGVAALSTASLALARDSVGASRNRISATRAQWLAEGCAERARAAISEAFARHTADRRGTASPWRSLDRVVDGSLVLSAVEDCAVEMNAAGMRVNINTASGEQLTRLFVVLGLTELRADSLSSAILDWRDADDVPHTTGAESAWYTAHSLRTPRNAPLADRTELRFVRGFDELPTTVQEAVLQSVDVESGRVPIGHAPLVTLASLPGFTEVVLGVVGAARESRNPHQDLRSIGAALPPAARADFNRERLAIEHLTTSDPDAWILFARGWSGAPSVEAIVELRLVRAGDRAAVTRRRTWLR
jgi:hypothetical protein